MAVSILEALQNAQFNLETASNMKSLSVVPLVQDQLRNAITLLEKGYDTSDLVEPLLEEYGDVQSVPDKE